MPSATSYAYLAYISSYEDLGLKVVPYVQDSPKALHKALAKTFTHWLITDGCPEALTLACNGKSKAFGDMPYDGYSLHTTLSSQSGLPSLVNELLGRISGVLDRFCASIELAAQNPSSRHEPKWLGAYGISFEALTDEVDRYCAAEIARNPEAIVVSEIAVWLYVLLESVQLFEELYDPAIALDGYLNQQ